MEPQSPTLDSNTESGGLPSAVPVWSLPLTPVTLEQTLDLIGQWVSEKSPRFLVTANVHYAMLCERDPELKAVNRAASMIVADGMPLVWASHGRLPERVAGSDLVPALCARAAERGWRLFFLGAGPGTAEAAAAILRARHPTLQIVGTESPPFRPLTSEELAAYVRQVQDARTDVLILSFAMPNGEKFMAEHFRTFGCPVTIQAGATLDFVAGRVSRAPRWMQRIGLEWFWRFLREPRRLARRYFRNGVFVLRMMFKRS
jgi:N-acetylglucosaminyldiphosphoundecaprenol N-acetyl-beta-D-mannosaminyltransferase